MSYKCRISKQCKPLANVVLFSPYLQSKMKQITYGCELITWMKPDVAP